MNLLGLAGLLIDGSATLIQGGRLVAAVEEERYARSKHASMVLAGGLPFQSIEACFRLGKIAWKDLDHIAYNFEPWREFFSLTGFRLRRSLLSPATIAYYEAFYLDTLRRHLAVPRLLAGRCHKDTEFHWFGHHLCHAASCYYPSPFEESAILVMDALSEIECTSQYRARGNQIEQLGSYRFPHSLGFFYSTMTDYLGFRSNNDEYKVMGLASFGKPRFLDELREVVSIFPSGEIRINFAYFDRYFRGREYFNDRFYRKLGPRRQYGDPLTERHADIAASLQRHLEVAVTRMARDLQGKTGLKNLCLAGGTALNCTVNGLLQREGPFEKIFIQPACHDAGGSLGAALLVKHRVLNITGREEMRSPYLGESFSENEIQTALEESKLKYQRVEDPAETAAEIIAGGRILAWFQGRAEWGPRALGNRSLLADPTRPDMQDIINREVKHRESFRPFAPAVTLEDAGEFFEGVEASPFMLFVVRARELARKKIPAVVHIDGTSRVQTVDSRVNPLFHRLLRKFESLKGVPVLLNTSFNINREPMVNSPQDAIRCFYSTGIDALVIGQYLVEKSRNRETG